MLKFYRKYHGLLSSKLARSGVIVSGLLILNKAILIYWMAIVSKMVSEELYGSLGYLRGITLQIGVVLSIGLTVYIPSISKVYSSKQILSLFNSALILIASVGVLAFPLFFWFQQELFGLQKDLWIYIYFVAVSMALYSIMIATSYAMDNYKVTLVTDFLLILIFVVLDIYVIASSQKIVSFTIFNLVRVGIFYLVVRKEYEHRFTIRMLDLKNTLKNSLPFLTQEVLVLFFSVIYWNQLVVILSSNQFAVFIVITQIIALTVFLPNSMRGWFLVHLSNTSRVITKRYILVGAGLYVGGFLLFYLSVPIMLTFFKGSYGDSILSNIILIYSIGFFMALGAITSQLLVLHRNLNVLSVFKGLRDFFLIVGMSLYSDGSLVAVLQIVLAVHIFYQLLIILKLRSIEGNWFLS